MTRRLESTAALTADVMWAIRYAHRWSYL